MTHRHVSKLALAASLALGALSLEATASAQSYRYVRSITPPLGEAYYQASFFDARRNRLLTFGVSPPYAGAIFQPDGTLVARIDALRLASGAGLDGAEYDAAMDRGLLVTQDCIVHEIDPAAFTVVTQRTLTGASVCAGVALGADGNLYVASYGSGEIVVYARTGTTPLRRFSTASIGNGLMDNLARLPGTSTFLTGTNTGTLAVIDANGVVRTGPGAIGAAAPLLGGMPVNADGAAGIASNGQVFICDHPLSPPPGTRSSCHFYAPGCARAADCPSATPVCVIPSGSTVGTCSVCGSDADCRAPGLSVCDPLLRVCLPAAPTVATPAEGAVTTNRRPRLAGTAAPRATVVVYLDGMEVARVMADAMGAWSYTPTADLPLGQRRLYAQTLVGAQLSAASPTVAFRVVACARDLDCPMSAPVCELSTNTCTTRPMPDAAVDAPVDATPDVPADAPADVPVDVPVDVPADVPVDAAPDVAEDAAVDVSVDAAPDVAEDAAADVTEDAVVDAPEDVAEDAAVDASAADVAVDRPGDVAVDRPAADASDTSEVHFTGDGACGCSAPGRAASWRGAAGLLAVLAVALRRRRAR